MAPRALDCRSLPMRTGSSSFKLREMVVRLVGAYVDGQCQAKNKARRVDRSQEPAQERNASSASSASVAQTASLLQSQGGRFLQRYLFYMKKDALHTKNMRNPKFTFSLVELSMEKVLRRDVASYRPRMGFPKKPNIVRTFNYCATEYTMKKKWAYGLGVNTLPMHGFAPAKGLRFKCGGVPGFTSEFFPFSYNCTLFSFKGI
ncbi:hypothetical protein BDP27DRAFT_1363145 [Rhodocollybia butyracea]|uniref:Uncharacterized protein n=1 Tax=Rhodocollybia butyracea TaxID=206335 RepID=A0A9P5PWY6_9AGAR|nr:hypothetical protein BDP27DRAFT_1363145 [Rhodocollybia butyracea]